MKAGTDTAQKGVIQWGQAALFAVSLNGANSVMQHHAFAVRACVGCIRGRTSPIYLHVVTSAGLLFVSALFNVELLAPPVLAGSGVCRHAMLAAPSLRGWIRCVCYGERWLGSGSAEAG